MFLYDFDIFTQTEEPEVALGWEFLGIPNPHPGDWDEMGIFHYGPVKKKRQFPRRNPGDGNRELSISKNPK